MSSTTTRQLAVVTGASNGIGFELAKKFAQEGWDLVVAAQSDDVQQVPALLDEYDVDIHVVQADLRTRAGSEAVWAKVTELGRPVDAMVPNAGVGLGGRFDQTDLDQELDMIELNVVSPVHLTKLAIRQMVPRGEGRVLLTSSVAATMPDPYEAVYGGTKSFLASFGEALQDEFKDVGITVTVLQPGPTDTNFFHRAEMDDTKAGQSKGDDPAKVAEQAYDALLAGHAKVTAGSPLNKVMAAAGRVLPEPVKAKVHEALSKPGSGKD